MPAPGRKSSISTPGPPQPAAAPPSETGLAAEFNADDALAMDFSGGADAPFEDELGTALPPPLAAAVSSWRRPAELLADGVSPCVLDRAVPAAPTGATPVSTPRDPPPADASLSRELTHALKAPAVEGCEEASRALLWLVSCMQLVASHASRIAPSTYLWELIYPKENGMPVASASGKYAVRLYDHGAWRLVIVDDRVPCDAAGKPLLPRTANPAEIWPMILAKALFKIGADPKGDAAPTDLDDDAAVRALSFSASSLGEFSRRIVSASSLGEFSRRYHRRDPSHAARRCSSG